MPVTLIPPTSYALPTNVPQPPIIRTPVQLVVGPRIFIRIFARVFVPALVPIVALTPAIALPLLTLIPWYASTALHSLVSSASKLSRYVGYLCPIQSIFTIAPDDALQGADIDIVFECLARWVAGGPAVFVDFLY